MGLLHSGAAAIDISPQEPQFLFGYPHVERYSTGIHDPLLSSALYLSNGDEELIFVANDIIFVGKELAQRARARITEETGIAPERMMLTATHTHSGPITVDYLSNEADAVVPTADPAYVQRLEDGIVSAALAAVHAARPAEIGLAVADGAGVGTNRRDPAGPADPEVPVLLVRERGGEQPIACMLVTSMHPTVLHEDSTVVSADFPGAARRFLQAEFLGADCPVLYHTGPAGNQSPRHVTRGNTLAEVERLGVVLGQRIAPVLPTIACRTNLSFSVARRFVNLPHKAFPSVAEAAEKLAQTQARFADLRASGAPRQEVRTAEVDLFGAEETLTLARAARDGRMAETYAACLPAEVQVLKIGDWAFVGWPGEVFVEYALAVKQRFADTFVISLANGELQGYIVTKAAAAQGGYEASNSLFPPAAGGILVETALDLLAALDQPTT